MKLKTLLCALAIMSGLTLNAQIPVTDGGDSGAGTLRQAIIDANADPDVSTINIDAALAISISGNVMTITEPVIINGNGSTISRTTGTGQLFLTLPGDNLASLAINDTTISDFGGSTSDFVTGGAINLNNVLVATFNDVSFINNSVDGAFDSSFGGGAISASSTVANTSVIVTDCTFTNNTALTSGTNGGAILMRGTNGALTVIGSAFTGNLASRAGGAIEHQTPDAISISSSTFTSNVAGSGVASPGNGGALHITGPANSTITGGSFESNVAISEGGALWNGTGTMTIDGVSINLNQATGNAADEGGGGIYALTAGTLIIQNSTQITNNRASGTSGSGGGILVDGASLNLTSSNIEGNIANRAGGGIEIVAGTGTATITGTSLLSNSVASANGATPNPGNGGALHISGNQDISISGGLVGLNSAQSEGGGLWNGTGLMTISGVAIANNIASGPTATEGGGGIFALPGGTVNITNGSTISDNIADGASGSGGGILVDAASLSVSDSSITGNRANRAGGGIEINAGAGSASLSNVTLDSNNAGVSPATAAPGNGGGLHITGMQDISISGGTASNNVAASEGGGLWNGTGTMTISGTTISGNTASGPSATEGGGGVFAFPGGTVNISGSATISDNIADGASGSGGGILVDAASLSVSDSSITGNRANRAGGGIEINAGAGSASLTNVTLDNNNAGVSPATAAPGNGGGLHITGMQNISITGGTVSNNVAASEGGGLWNGTGTMTISGVTISVNTASGPTATEGGGGVFALPGGTVNISGNSTISGNIADGASGSGGGILVDAASLSVSNSSITGNRANRAGGGIEINAGAGSASLTNVTLDNNNAGVSPATAAPGNGGGLHITGMQDISITGGTVNNNTAALEGGGLWNGTGIMTIAGVTVDGNSALGNDADTGGGGIFILDGGTVNATNSTSILNNVASGTSGSGGGVLMSPGSSFSMDSGNITDNEANRAGGGIEFNNVGMTAGLLSLTDVSMSGNNAGSSAPNPGSGGAIHISGTGNANISGGTTSNNVATNQGGAFWNGTGVMNVTDVTLSNNTSGNDGGAIYVDGGAVNVTTSTLNDNGSTSGNGGGIGLGTAGTASLDRVTISGNSAGANGAGVYASGSTIATITKSTIAFNMATGNGGGLSSQGSITIDNTLVSNNTAATGMDVEGSITSADYNLVLMDDLNAFTAMTNDIEGIDPGLMPLADNGGFTETHAISFMVAQDQGDPGDNTVDQRGEGVFNTIRDIGSYEAQMTLSSEDFDQERLSTTFYPNPSTGLFNLNLSPAYSSELSYQVYAISGAVVAKGSLSNTRTTELDLQQLASGSYILRLQDDQNSETFRLVIQ